MRLRRALSLPRPTKGIRSLARNETVKPVHYTPYAEPLRYTAGPPSGVPAAASREMLLLPLLASR